MKKILLILLIMSGFLFAGSMSNIGIFAAYDISVSAVYIYGMNIALLTPASNDYLVQDNIATEVVIKVDTLFSTSIDYTIQCSNKIMDFVEIYNKRFGAIQTLRIPIMERCYTLAIGAKCNGCAAGDSITAYISTYR
jgi:hypothetical protein